MGSFSIGHWAIVLLIVVLIFGKRLRSIGSDLGGTLRGFKDALREGDEKPSEVASSGSSRD